MSEGASDWPVRSGAVTKFANFGLEYVFGCGVSCASPKEEIAVYLGGVLVLEVAERARRVIETGCILY